MANKKYFTGRSLSLQEQKMGLLGLFPGCSINIHKNKLIWIGYLKPTCLSHMYKIKIEYEIGSNPQCYVIEPKLKIVKGETRLPHVYNNEKQRICLFMPHGNIEWNSSMNIARTITPWASEWLLFYELWLATGGEWLGEDVHPPRRDD